MQILVPFYIILCLISIIVYMYKKSSVYISHSNGVKRLLCLLFFIFFILLVGGRSFDHHGDTATYLLIFKSLHGANLFSTFNDYRVESGYLLLTSLLSKVLSDKQLFLISIATLQSILWYICIIKWVDKSKVLLSVIIFISLFFSYNLGANIIRQGLAIPLSFISLKFLFEDKRKIGILLIILSVLLHKTTIVVFLAWLISNNKIDIKYYFIVWFLCSVFSILGFFTNIVTKSMLNLGTYQYLATISAYSNYNTGFRLYFWLFSFIPIILYYFVKLDCRSKYVNIIKVYLIFYSFFIIMFEIPYSDRIGLYSWAMLPFLLPLFINDYKFKILNSKPLWILIMLVIGVLSFQFYSIMDIGIHMNQVF